MCTYIMAHLDGHKLLSDRQQSFRMNCSYETRLITVINNWAKTDAGGQVETFILDFKKAFNTPPHELLKCKHHLYGISGKFLVWIDSFLCNRQRRVAVSGAKSQWSPVLFGVPQGTVLGLLLFSLYINDIMVGIEYEIQYEILFADDCLLLSV